MTEQTTSTRKTPEQRKAEQAAAAEQAKRDAATVEAALKTADNATDEERFGASLLRKATELRDERERITKQTASNRDMLRGMRDQNLISKAQAAAVEILYPTPKRADDSHASTNGASAASTPPPATPPTRPAAAAAGSTPNR